jgi:hypothetical protein
MLISLTSIQTSQAFQTKHARVAADTLRKCFSISWPLDIDNDIWRTNRFCIAATWLGAASLTHGKGFPKHVLTHQAIAVRRDVFAHRRREFRSRNTTIETPSHFASDYPAIFMYWLIESLSRGPLHEVPSLHISDASTLYSERVLLKDLTVERTNARLILAIQLKAQCYNRSVIYINQGAVARSGALISI